jgi:hypothetical protein
LNASRQTFVTSALVCALLAALFVARYLLAPMPVEVPFDGGMPLAATLTRFTEAHPWLAGSIAVVVAVWTLAVVVQLTIRYAPAASRNYLPAQIFILCTAGIAISGQPLPALMVAWLFVLATRQFARSFHKGYAFDEIFHGALYAGTIPLLYAPALFVAPVVALSALAIYRRSGREGMVCLTGLLVPFAIAWFTGWAVGDGAGLTIGEIWRYALRGSHFWESLPLSLLGVAVPLSALTLVGVFRALSNRKSIRRTQYKFMQHASLTLLAVVASGVLAGSSATFFALVATPCALSIPYAFSGKMAVVSTVFYCLILMGVCVVNLLPVLGVSLP